MIGILFLWYCLCLHHDIRDFILHPHYLNGYLKHSGYSINTCWMHENNEWRVVSDWMDCYRHLAITALFLNESLASTPLYLTPPPNFSSPTCFPMDMFSIRQFHAWSGFLQPSHHIWIRICFTPEYDRILTASWQCPYCSPFHPLSWLLPLHLSKHSVALSTNVLPQICLSFQGRQMPPSSSRTPDPPFRS